MSDIITTDSALRAVVEAFETKALRDDEPIEKVAQLAATIRQAWLDMAAMQRVATATAIDLAGQRDAANARANVYARTLADVRATQDDPDALATAKELATAWRLVSDQHGRDLVEAKATILRLEDELKRRERPELGRVEVIK